MALWISGGEKLLRAIGESIGYGIPCLARASLVTIAWMSKFVHTVGDGDVLQSAALSTLIRKLIDSLNRDNTIEERVLASFSLLALSKSSGIFLIFVSLTSVSLCLDGTKQDRTGYTVFGMH